MNRFTVPFWQDEPEEKKGAHPVASSLAAAAALAAMGAAAAYFTTKLLMGISLDRKVPPLAKKMPKGMIAGSVIKEEYRARSDADAAELAARPTETVILTAPDGVELVGHLLQADKPRRILLAMHGWRSTWSHDFASVAKFWEKEGCTVLFAEQRGQNDSGGASMGMGTLERRDVSVWVDYLVSRFPGRLPIYLTGVSMGATTVLMSAAETFPSRVRGIIADCGFTSPKAIWKHIVAHNLHLPYGLNKPFVDLISEQRLGQGNAQASTLTAMRGAKVPVCFIHGSADTFVPVEMTYENYAACAAPKELLIVPGAGHGLSYYVEQEKYEDFVRSFFAKYDKAAPTAVPSAIAAVLNGREDLDLVRTVPAQKAEKTDSSEKAEQSESAEKSGSEKTSVKVPEKAAVRGREEPEKKPGKTQPAAKPTPKKEAARGEAGPAAVPGLTKNEGKVLALLREKPESTREEMAEQIGKTVKTVQRTLDSLKERGIIEREGTNRRGSWKIDESKI